MLLLSLLVLIAQQGDEYSCSGTKTTRDCRAPDGSTYIERKLGDDRIIRKGTAPNGDSWTEYVHKQFDGTRTQGTDSSGRTWFQQCSEKTGTRGTDRQGNAIFIPPRPRRIPQPGDTNPDAEYDPCR